MRVHLPFLLKRPSKSRQGSRLSSRSGAAALEYLIVSTCAATLALGVMAYVTKQFKERMTKLNDTLDDLQPQRGPKTHSIGEKRGPFFRGLSVDFPILSLIFRELTDLDGLF